MKGANKQDIQNQREFNKEVNSLVDQYGNLLATSKEINEERVEELRSTREISDEIRKQLGAVKQNLDFKTSTRRILNEINKLSEQNVDLAKDEKNILLDEESIQKRQQKLAQTKLGLFRESQFVRSKIISLENDIEASQGDQKEILEEQLKTFKRLEQSLGDQVESSESLSKNLSQARKAAQEVNKVSAPKGFEFLSDLTDKIPGFRKLSGPFKEAAKQSKDVAARMTKINLQRNQMGKANMFSKSQIGMKALGKGFAAFGPILKKALGPISLVIAAVDVVKFFFKSMVAGSKATARMSNNMLVSRDAARELYKTTIPGVVGEFNEASKAAGGVTITIGAYERALASVNDQLGLQLNLTEDFGKETALNVAEVAKMTENFGYSAKASKELFFEATKTGKPLEEINKSIFGTVGELASATGIIPDFAKLLDEAANVSGNLKANFGGSVSEIAKAAFEAKLLGLSLSQMEGISSSLLDFQSSIENEMAAELLTGKQLNLERAREAALMGDTETLMKEISEQAGSQKDFLKMNIIQRQALAKAVGMEVNELADMFDKQSKMDALRKKNLEVQNKLKAAGLNIDDKNFDLEKASLQEIRAAAQAAGKSEAELRDLLGDQIYARKQEEDATQKFNKALEQAKDAFARLVDGGALDGLVDILTGITESSLFAGFKEEGEAKRIADAAKETKDQEKIDIANKALEAQKQATGTDDVTDVGGAALGGAAAGAAIGSLFFGIGAAPGAAIGALVGGVGAAIKNVFDQNTADSELEAAKALKLNTENTDDFIIRPGQPVQKFNKGDLVVGGTNLGGNNNEVTTLLKELISTVKQGGDVYIDGAKAGKSLVMATSRMG